MLPALLGLGLLAAARAFPADATTQVSLTKDALQPPTLHVAKGFLGNIGQNYNIHPEEANVPVARKMYNIIETVLVNVFRPQPIIDNIREEDKYGNDGEKFNKVGRSVVGGVETLTTLLASAADFPVNTLKSFTRQATATLNTIGSKLVGLTR